jgi:uncharacterized low-complexity protein
MKNTMKKSLSIAIGTTFIAAMSASPVANADANPFGMQKIESGYMQVADGKCGSSMKKDSKMKDGKCGTGKCGANKMKKEGKCGANKMKKEGKCGASK